MFFNILRILVLKKESEKIEFEKLQLDSILAPIQEVQTVASKKAPRAYLNVKVHTFLVRIQFNLMFLFTKHANILLLSTLKAG